MPMRVLTEADRESASELVFTLRGGGERRALGLAHRDVPRHHIPHDDQEPTEPERSARRGGGVPVPPIRTSRRERMSDQRTLDLAANPTAGEVLDRIRRESWDEIGEGALVRASVHARTQTATRVQDRRDLAVARLARAGTAHRTGRSRRWDRLGRPTDDGRVGGHPVQVLRRAPQDRNRGRSTSSSAAPRTPCSACAGSWRPAVGLPTPGTRSSERIRRSPRSTFGNTCMSRSRRPTRSARFSNRGRSRKTRSRTSSRASRTTTGAVSSWPAVRGRPSRRCASPRRWWRTGDASSSRPQLIALMSQQARREWLRHTTRRLRCVVVCSDRTAGGPHENEDIRVSELECPVSTDPSAIARTRLGDGTTHVVFCTYHSLGKVTRGPTEAWGSRVRPGHRRQGAPHDRRPPAKERRPQGRFPGVPRRAASAREEAAVHDRHASDLQAALEDETGSPGGRRRSSWSASYDVDVIVSPLYILESPRAVRPRRSDTR